MARGKWGITRDDDGTLSSVWLWPWFWRYPAGLSLLIAISIWAIIDSNSWSTGAWITAGSGLLISLSVMYELGCLVIVLGIGALVWVAVDALFPDFDFKLPITVQVAMIAAFAYYAWHIGNEARRLSEKNKESVDRIWEYIRSIEESRKEATGSLYTRIADLERRIIRIERDQVDPFNFD